MNSSFVSLLLVCFAALALIAIVTAMPASMNENGDDSMAASAGPGDWGAGDDVHPRMRRWYGGGGGFGGYRGGFGGYRGGFGGYRGGFGGYRGYGGFGR